MGKEKKSKIYFGVNTETAIREYIKCKNRIKKEEIYLKKIQPAFNKLVENIINMPKFNFKRLDSYQSLHNEVIAHLYSNIGKFNPRRKSKKTGKAVRAFSYFGTIAKNYLVQQSIRRSKINYLTESNIESQEIDINNNSSLIAENFENKLEMTEFIELLIEHYEKYREFYTLNKKKVCDAILYFLKNVQRETIYNKKHFYLLLRELTGLNAKQITIILSEFKKDYQKIKEKYYEDFI